MGNTLNQSTEFGTKSWVEINDDASGTCNTNSQIKFKTSIFKSGLCDCSDGYLLVSGTISVQNRAADGPPTNNTDKKVVFENFFSFTDKHTRK